MERDRFMNSIKRYVSYIVNESQKGECKVIFAADKKRGRKSANAPKTLGVCPNCGGHIFENSKAYYCSNWRQGCKFTLWKNGLENYSVEINADLASHIINDKEVKNVNIMYNGIRSTADILLNKSNTGRLDVTNIRAIQTAE